MKINLLIVFALSLLCGCETTSDTINGVKLGMTEAEVIKVMGKPKAAADGKEGRTLYYTLREDWRGAINAGYSVKLVNGKVDWYGRESLPSTEQGAVIAPVFVK